MKLIRNNVFETNSSSCHSISVGNSDVFQGYTPNDDGTIELPNTGFGWEQDTFTDPESRMAYVWIYIRDWCGDGEKQAKFLTMFNEVVKAHTGATEITMVEETRYGYKDQGYIDHQSVECSDLDHLFVDNATLKSFLFDRDSEIETDNDNH